MDLSVNEKYIFEKLLERYPDLIVNENEIRKAYEIFTDCVSSGGKLLVCGNGGSAADAEHIVGELMKGFNKSRSLDEAEKKRYGEAGNYLQGALPAISLTQHQALSTAYMNDVNPKMVFAQQVYGYGCEKDVLLAISTSGNSENILRAIEVAKGKCMRTIALTGNAGGSCRMLCDCVVSVVRTKTFEIQEYHLPIYHAWCAMLEERFFPN